MVFDCLLVVADVFEVVLGGCRSFLHLVTTGLLTDDTFESHVTKNVKAVCAKENTNLALIPRRLTSVV